MLILIVINVSHDLFIHIHTIFIHIPPQFADSWLVVTHLSRKNGLSSSQLRQLYRKGGGRLAMVEPKSSTSDLMCLAVSCIFLPPQAAFILEHVSLAIAAIGCEAMSVWKLRNARDHLVMYIGHSCCFQEQCCGGTWNRVRTCCTHWWLRHSAHCVCLKTKIQDALSKSQKMSTQLHSQPNTVGFTVCNPAARSLATRSLFPPRGPFPPFPN